MNIIGTLKEKITQYADVYIKLFKVNFIGRTAGVLSYLLFALICMFILFCVLLFFGFGVAEAMFAMGLSKVASFFITLGIYVILLVIIIAMRTRITRFFASGIINVMTEGDEEDSESK